MNQQNKIRYLLIFACLLLSACAPVGPMIEGPLVETHAAMPSSVKGQEAPISGGMTPTSIESTPKLPSADKSSTIKPATAPSSKQEKPSITVAFDQMPLPSFVQAIYGVILKKNYSMDPQVASRTDLVTLHAAELQTPDQIENAARLLLKTYGVAVTDLGAGNYRIVPDNSQTGYSPEILRGRALPEVPLPLRPIYQLVELQAVQSNDVASWLTKIYGSKVSIINDPAQNTLILGGQSDEVTTVLEAIHVLDQPLMKGRHSVRINPVFWSANDLSKKLVEILTAEGYSATNSPAQAGPYPINIIPIEGVNALIVFAADPQILDHIVEWAKEFDKPNTNPGSGGGYFAYQVQYTNADSLAKTMREIMGDSVQPSAALPANQAVGVGMPVGVGTPAASKQQTGHVIVNAATNTLIFQGSSENHVQLLNLLQELDKPAKSALIEVTVAEVTLDNSTQLGVEWALSASGANGATIVGGTAPGIAMGAAGVTSGIGAGVGGLTIARLNSVGNLRQLLNLLATSSKANVLSTPRILARNGETASIQVGAQIPTISMQQTNAATGGIGVLQSVQYIDTGIILKVKPIIYAGDRIDLDVSQEVSGAAGVGVAGSPIITTRKVDTHLSLRDGSPVLLGGLISSNDTNNDTGVPLLKDIPVLGQLFRNTSRDHQKTELLILITPYIVADDHDAQEITDAFRNRLGEWARPATPPLLPGKEVVPAALPQPRPTVAPVSETPLPVPQK